MVELVMINLKKKKTVNYLLLIRWTHWLKSIFVMIGFFFSGLWFNNFIAMIIAVFAFGFAANAIYIFNDIQDLNFDREHPTKKSRPLASGLISIEQAKPFMILLILFSFSLSFVLSTHAVFIISLYITINIFYSKWLKHIPYIDVLCIGSGFMLRILMGTWAINIAPSHWLLICGTTLSLFLAFSKRKLEMQLYLLNKTTFRPVLEKYSNKILSICLFSTALVTFYSYISYVLSMAESHYQGRWLFVTIPLALFGFIRYTFLMYTKTKCSCPIKLFISDRYLIFNLLIFIFIVFMALF